MFENSVVRAWMVSKVITVLPNVSISEAHNIMRNNTIRRLPVVSPEGHLLGIVTLGDVREASPSKATSLSIWELNYLWAQLTVERVMTHKVISITPDTPMVEAARLMLEHKISGLPVVEDGKVVGMITESDIFRMVVKASVATT
jgi:acetoin utilization protein AcuB